MRLTDSTTVRLLANGFVAAYEPGRPAVLVPPAEQFPCGDQYYGLPAFVLDPAYEGDWYADSPADMIQSCNAVRVAFDNGSACVNGHTHYNYVPAS